MATISEAFAAAVQHHQAGRFEAAEQIYRQILQVEPNQPDALHLLGVMACQVGKPELGIAYIQQAIQLKEAENTYHYNLGSAYLTLGRLGEAVACFRRALELKPDHCETHNSLGNALQRQGQLNDAMVCYRRAIELQPNSADAFSNLGNALAALGRPDEAAAHCRRALELNPGLAEAHSNLGNALQCHGKLNDAAACYRRALELKPHYPEAQNNLGNVLLAQKNLDDAVASYRRALELQPDLVDAHYNLSNALQAQGKLEEAAACCRRALELQPDYAAAHNNLGNIFQSQGRLDDSIACYLRALELRPDFADAHYNLAHAYQAQEKLEDAVACYRRALELQPDLVDAHYNLGNVLLSSDRLDEAAACYRRSIELQPDFAKAHHNLGNVSKAQGNLTDAIACFQRALELMRGDAETHSNLIVCLHYSSDFNSQQIYAEQCRWDEWHARPLAELIQPHSNERSADRRLRIGYVSPDFRNHVVGLFLLPLLEAHDRQGFEIYCYASVISPDRITEHCRARCDVWRDVRSLSDEQLATVIRDDRIDILVDLSMHMAGNRLLLFARKPAPVQVAYLACVGATGLSTMDYRLSDPYLDPPPIPGQAIGVEEAICLPETYWCYRPLVQAPDVSAPPALHAGWITFGCLNNFCKVSDSTLATWAALLHAMPASRLLLHAFPGSHRDRVRSFFAQQSLSPERIAFAATAPIKDYYRLYHQIDVALDPFPYGGGTTTCDALWMGVPVVSLAGQTQVGRAGLSILSNIGCAGWVARDPQQYVRIAQGLAGDLPRLSELRATLRERLRSSPLMNFPRFAGNIESAYRTMWRRWCEQQAS